MADPENRLIQIVMVLAALTIAGLLLRNHEVATKCEERHCEHGRPMAVKDQSKIASLVKCVCAEEPK